MLKKIGAVILIIFFAQTLFAVDNKNIIHQVVGQTDIATALESILKNINIKQYMSFNLIGVNGKIGNEANLYIQIMPDKKRVCIATGIICAFDTVRFQQKCMPYLREIFDSILFEHKHVFVSQLQPKMLRYTLPTRLPYETDIWADIMHLPKKEIASLKITPSIAITHNTIKKAVSEAYCKHPGRYKIILNISDQYSPGGQKFICYSFSKYRSKRVFNPKTIKKKIFGNLAVSLCLFDGDGHEIKRITQKIADLNFYGAGWIDSYNATIISPEFFMKEGNYDDYNSSVIVQPVVDIIDLETFKNVKSFKLKVTDM